LITTPGATRFYRSAGALAEQSLVARLAADARLEWLPLETIAYSGTQASNRMRFELDPGAEMIGWDVLALGLPAAGEPFAHGRFEQQIELPGAWLERGVLDTEDPLTQRLLATRQPAGMGRPHRAGDAVVCGRRGHDGPETRATARHGQSGGGTPRPCCACGCHVAGRPPGGAAGAGRTHRAGPELAARGMGGLAPDGVAPARVPAEGVAHLTACHTAPQGAAGASLRDSRADRAR
jgi:hypothetical protein